MYEDRSLTDHDMFIELTSVIPDADGAPLKESKALINISTIKSIIPSKDINIDSNDENQRVENWRIWNETYISLQGGGCMWIKQSYQEIKELLQKALNTRF